MEEKLKSAVLFLVFRRPEQTARVFEAIRRARPQRLYVAADGPRSQNPDEVELCRRTRETATAVDWECEVHTLFRNENLGCRKAVSGALDWFFQEEEEGIILEDDILPQPEFFPFCQDLLERFRDDERVMHISGVNFQAGKRRNDFSYYFSRYNHCWGWASWRRAWELYDRDMSLWPWVRDAGYLEDILTYPDPVRYWTRQFDLAAKEVVDSWAYRWTFSCWVQNGLTVLPSVNLISNLGFTSDATHTGGNHLSYLMETGKLEFPLRHPPALIRDEKADWRTHTTVFNPGMLRRGINRLRRLQGGRRG